MEKVNWSFQEVFYFPESFGTPTGTTLVDVKPRFEFQQNDGYCCLNGIYHISANVSFEPGVCEHHGVSEWVSIEDLEMNGENGYFEYAVPHSIELPPEYKHGQISPEVSISDISPIVTNEKAIQIKWNVECTYEKDKVEELLTMESSSSSSSSVELIEPVSERLESLEPVSESREPKPFYLKDLKESYSVYQVK
ncbi:MAG: hypothetical protein ACE3JQ_09010 [Paenisporosarcina sp.]